MQKLTLNELLHRTMIGDEAFYLASEVEDMVDRLLADKNKSIAELERKKGLLWQRLHDLDEQLLDVLGHWRGTKSHELIVDLLTECRTN